MKGFYDELILEPEAFSFRRKPNYQYMSSTGLFTVHKVSSSNWIWSPLASAWKFYPYLENILYANNSVAQIAYSKAHVQYFSSLQKARDHAIETFSHYLPEEIPKTMRFTDSNRYILKVENKVVRDFVCVRRHNLRWMSPYLKNKFLKEGKEEVFEGQKFATRKDFFLFMYRYVSDYLNELFLEESEKYKTEREQHLIEGKNQFDLWWMGFVDLKFNLFEIF